MERCRRNLGLYARRTVACARSACTDCGSCLYLIEGDIVSIHCPYGQKVQLSSSDCQCMASSSDALSSIGTASGIGGAILLGPHWVVLDPIAAVIVSFFIMKVSVKLLVPCIDELLEKSLPESVEHEIEQTVLAFDGVTEPHHLRTRRIGNNYAIEIHVRMNGDIPLYKAHETATAIERKLKEKYGEDTHVGIHVEPVK